MPLKRGPLPRIPPIGDARNHLFEQNSGFAQGFPSALDTPVWDKHFPELEHLKRLQPFQFWSVYGFRRRFSG